MILFEISLCINIFFIFIKKMQRGITDKVYLGKNLNPLDDSLGVESVDYPADFNSMLKKLDKLKMLYDKGSMDTDLLRYIQGLSKIFFQDQIDKIMTKKMYATSIYKDKIILNLVVI